MILITGATGQLGRAVLHTLARKADPATLAALVRDPAKAADLAAQGISIRVGDYGDPASLAAAMRGVTKVLLISGGGEADALQQHYHVVDAARQAGVQCLAYTGRALRDPATLANQLMVRHFQTEDYIRASGLPYVFFRNILYLDALPQFVGPQVLETGISLPAGAGRVAFALRREQGEAIANALLTEPCHHQTYHLTGAKTYSFADVAAALAALAGRPVAYTPIEAPVFAARLQQRGLPPIMAERIIGFLTDIKNGQEDLVSHDLERLLGRQPTTLSEGVGEVFRF